jgi:hypothetical protein
MPSKSSERGIAGAGGVMGQGLAGRAARRKWCRQILLELARAGGSAKRRRNGNGANAKALPPYLVTASFMPASWCWLRGGLPTRCAQRWPGCSSKLPEVVENPSAIPPNPNKIA